MILALQADRPDMPGLGQNLAAFLGLGWIQRFWQWSGKRAESSGLISRTSTFISRLHAHNTSAWTSWPAALGA
eukprot:193319-Pelagomonas_calceolata.AAC.2